MTTPPTTPTLAASPRTATAIPPLIPAAKPLIGHEERLAVNNVLLSGMLAQGPEVAAFEAEFAEHFVGGRPTVALNSGTSGQHLGLLASGIGPGDEVIVPSFTFAAVANSVALTGATPVFADIEPTHFTLAPDAVRAAITERTAGIMPVHLYGHPFQVDALSALAAEHGIMLFEDAAQAHGARWNDAPVGSFGEFAMFSLYPTKNMTAIEGGMVACRTADTARRLRLLRNQGMETQYANEVVGFNARMSDMHAAVGRVQLRKVDAWTHTRQANAAFFDRELGGVGGLVTPRTAPEATHVYHQYTVRVPAAERDRVRAALHDEHGVGTGVYYPIPNHRLPSLRQYAPEFPLPESDRAAAEVLSLPVHPSLTAGELDRIVAGVTAVMTAGA
ncbi:DegT/DnrJ/EryC1/StrS family aminotransferase [Leucobacter chromiireducens]|uniref:DegT/DnrJ/EryC1/StrS family aminotransferase n=1 Tax=Leucobacter chromiireducens subsp. solipictus TaxID=398235 RepID=A0ABS1SF22_9MICO|nr:DegT/DnrJ/EryC1/StrS family aminotransferase [Leucobacter chromiireducens]MBL3679150.1 DegT/DnrJ/EryC1/StrS family aminotransferase [Leucobacter chromiireducens subsp. solipictus]